MNNIAPSFEIDVPAMDYLKQTAEWNDAQTLKVKTRCLLNVFTRLIVLFHRNYITIVHEEQCQTPTIC